MVFITSGPGLSGTLTRRIFSRGKHILNKHKNKNNEINKKKMEKRGKNSLHICFT